MIKNITRVLLILLLAIFSFYYTNKSIELVREQDPIMKTIRSTSDKYNIKAVSAEIIENTIAYFTISILSVSDLHLLLCPWQIFLESGNKAVDAHPKQ